VQIAITAVGVILSVLLTILWWQVRAWVRQQQLLSDRIAALEAAIAALRVELVQQRSEERDRSDDRTRALAASLEQRIREEIREHRESCRAHQDAITGVRGMPTDPHGVPRP
jgi:hypothetical protein